MHSLRSVDLPAPPTTPCVPWTGRIRDDGYGTLGVKMAHRAVWEDAIGPIPDGLELDHLCRNRACVRLDHLEPVTHQENIRRAKAYQVLKETCKHGHTGEYRNDASGKRYCAGCKRDRTRAERIPKALGDPCGKGHTFDRQTARGVRCSACMSIAGKAAMAVRWGS